MDLQLSTNQINSDQLNVIRANFAPRDLYNVENTRPEPNLIFGEYFGNASLTNTTLSGLKYPLELDGNGSLVVSYGYERVAQQIVEVLETRFAERVLRPFLGTPEILFETISESVLAEDLKSQVIAGSGLLSPDSLRITVRMTDNGDCMITVIFSVEGSEERMVRYRYGL